MVIKLINNQNTSKKVEIHAGLCRQLNKIYEQKNHDYGDSFEKVVEETKATKGCGRCKSYVEDIVKSKLNK